MTQNIEDCSILTRQNETKSGVFCSWVDGRSGQRSRFKGYKPGKTEGKAVE
jgi:hypothetical protein